MHRTSSCPVRGRHSAPRLRRWELLICLPRGWSEIGIQIRAISHNAVLKFFRHLSVLLLKPDGCSQSSMVNVLTRVLALVTFKIFFVMATEELSLQ